MSNERDLSEELVAYTTRELAQEIAARSEAVVLGYVDKGDPEAQAQTYTNGSFLMCLGMIEHIKTMHLIKTYGVDLKDELEP